MRDIMNSEKIHLYLVLELLCENNYFEEYIIILDKFIKTVKVADFLAVVARYKNKIEIYNRKIYNFRNNCIDSRGKSKSII